MSIVSFALGWAVNRLKEKTTYIGLGIAAFAYFGVTIAPDCTGINLCMTEDTWAKVVESGAYIISTFLVLYRESKAQPVAIEPMPDAKPKVKNSELEKSKMPFPPQKKK